MNEIDKSSLDKLIEIVGNADSKNKSFNSQKEMADLIGVNQSAISKLIKKSGGKIVKDGKSYHLSRTLQREQHKSILEKIFSDEAGSICEISPFAFAVRINPLYYKTVSESVKGFFGSWCFGTFCAEDMLIVILKSNCDLKRIKKFKLIVSGKSTVTSSAQIRAK